VTGTSVGQTDAIKNVLIYILHLCNGLFSRTTWVSWYQKGRTILDLNEARDNGVAVASAGPYANYLHFAADNHISTSSLNFLQAGCVEDASSSHFVSRPS